MSNSSASTSPADAARTATGAPPFRKITACPLCGGTEIPVIRREKNAFIPEVPFFDAYRQWAPECSLRRCGGCGFAFTDELPADPAFYEHLYGYRYRWEDEYLADGKGLVRAQARRMVLKYCPGGRLLDVGAAMGAMMKAMADKFEVAGVEIHPGPSEFGRSKGLDIRTGTFLGVPWPDASFDAVTFVDVLEHLPEPARVLEKARTILKPNGVLFIKVPHYVAQANKEDFAVRMGRFSPGIMSNYGHINHFSPTSIAKHLSTHGFQVLEQGFCPPILGHVAPELPLVRKLQLGFANGIRRTVTGTLNLTAQLTGLPLGLNLFVVARRQP